MNNEPGSRFAQGFGPVHRSGNGCHLTMWALAILGAFGAFGAVVAGLVLLLGPANGLGRPAGFTVLLAYLAFALACILGTFIAWFILAIKQKPGTSRGLGEPRQPMAEPDSVAAPLPASAKSDEREANESAQASVVTNCPNEPPEPPQEAVAGDPARLKVSPEEFRNIARRYLKNVPASQKQFHPGKLTRSTGEPEDTSPRQVQSESNAKHGSSPASAEAKNPKVSTGLARKHKQGDASSRCQHGKRRGYCAICDWEAYKDMQGRWEED